jgi:hypothetical protein
MQSPYSMNAQLFDSYTPAQKLGALYYDKRQRGLLTPEQDIAERKYIIRTFESELRRRPLSDEEKTVMTQALQQLQLEQNELEQNELPQAAPPTAQAAPPTAQAAPPTAQAPLQEPVEFDNAEMERAIQMSLEPQRTGAEAPRAEVPRAEVPRAEAAMAPRIQPHLITERDKLNLSRLDIPIVDAPRFIELDTITNENIAPGQFVVELKDSFDNDLIYITRTTFNRLGGLPNRPFHVTQFIQPEVPLLQNVQPLLLTEQGLRFPDQIHIPLINAPKFIDQDGITLDDITPGEVVVEIKSVQNTRPSFLYTTRENFNHYVTSRREINPYIPVKHPMFTINLAGCSVTQFVQPPRPTGGRKTKRRKQRRRKTKRRR